MAGASYGDDFKMVTHLYEHGYDFRVMDSADAVSVSVFEVPEEAGPFMHHQVFHLG